MTSFLHQGYMIFDGPDLTTSEMAVITGFTNRPRTHWPPPAERRFRGFTEPMRADTSLRAPCSPGRDADLTGGMLAIRPGNVGGIVQVGAAKAAIAGLLALAFAADGPIHLSRVPDSSDWTESLENLRRLGCSICLDRSRGLLGLDHPACLVGQHSASRPMQSRALLPLTGLLARAGHLRLPLPGGCNIGPRPLNLHIRVLRQFGIDLKICPAALEVRCTRRAKPQAVVLSGRSVGESQQALMTALTTPGEWPIMHLADSPETRFLVEAFTRLGIGRRLGRHSAVVFGGTRISKGSSIEVPSDPIEAGNWAILGGLSYDGVYLPCSKDPDLARLLSKLASVGLLIDRGTDLLRVRRGNTTPRLGVVSTREGIHTDYHSALMALATTGSSWTLFRDDVFPGRVAMVREIAHSTHRSELLRIGQCLLPCRWRSWRLIGPAVLAARDFWIPDIRTGFGQVLLGLLAQEPFRLHGIHVVRRGFPRIELNLQSLGQYVTSPPAPLLVER